MSDSDASLRASVLKSRIARLPQLPAIHPHAESSSSNAAASTIAPLGPPPRRRPGRPRGAAATAGSDTFGPLSAQDCFEQALEVDVRYPPGASSTAATFRVYYTPPRLKRSRSGPSIPADDLQIDSLQPPALATAGLGQRTDAADEDDDDDDADDDAQQGGDDAGTVIVLHHGAGFGGLSYALAAREITRLTKGKAGVLSFDCRGHGRTKVEPPESSTDMSLATLSTDLVLVLQSIFGKDGGTPWPKLLLVGHSMGGSVVTKAVEHLQALAKSSTSPAVPVSVSVLGLAVLDVVEGTALDALDGMRAIVQAQPTGFASVEAAVRWHVDTGVLMNLDSARRSVPSLLVPNPAHGPAQGRAAEGGAHDEEAAEEEVEEVLQDDRASEAIVDRVEHKLKWKADLLSTQPYWRGWFEGMSTRFLTARTARLLLLAGTDRLDKELMIGQMQGKYQLVVFPEVGHCLHEDAPERTAQVLVEFWRRNQQSVVPLARLRPSASRPA